jgi:hypothetical protein
MCKGSRKRERRTNIYQLSKIVKDWECTESDCYYGVTVDHPYQLPPKGLREISFLAKNPESPEMITDDNTIDTMLAYSQYGVKVILEIPFDGREVDAKCLMSIFSQFRASLSILPPENASVKKQDQYISLVNDFVNTYITDEPLNFVASLYPISNCYEDLMASHFAGKDISTSSSHPYIIERIRKNMSSSFVEKVEKRMKESIINRIFSLVRDDNGASFENPNEAFVVYADTMANCILNNRKDLKK